MGYPRQIDTARLLLIDNQINAAADRVGKKLANLRADNSAFDRVFSRLTSSVGHPIVRLNPDSPVDRREALLRSLREVLPLGYYDVPGDGRYYFSWFNVTPSMVLRLRKLDPSQYGCG